MMGIILVQIYSSHIHILLIFKKKLIKSSFKLLKSNVVDKLFVPQVWVNLIMGDR